MTLTVTDRNLLTFTSRTKAWLRKRGLFLTLLFSIASMAFPTRFSDSYSPIQSIELFGSGLTIFGIFYVLAVSFGLATGSVLEKSDAKRGAYIAFLLTFVSLEFWNLRSNFPIPISDGQVNHSFVQVVAATGHLSTYNQPGFNSNFFTTWPSMQTLGASLQVLLGLSTTTAMILELSAMLTLVSFAAYLFFRNVTRSTFLGLVGVVLLTSFSARYQLYFYTPNNLAFAFTVLAFWLLSRAYFESVWSRGSSVVFSLLVVAISLTNFLASFFFVSVSLTFWLVSSRKRLIHPFIPLLLAFSILPPLFSGGLGIIAASAKGFLNGGVLSQLFSFYASKSSSGGLIPTWAADVTIFWQAFMAFPALMGLFLLLWKRRALDARLMFICTGILGLIPFGVGLASGGGYYVTVILGVVPLFSVPLVLLMVGTRNRSKLLATLVLIMIVLSLPTFLAYNRNQNLWKLYPQDIAGYTYVMNQSLAQPGTTVYMTGVDTMPYLVEGLTVVYPMASFLTESQLWAIWNNTLGTLADQGRGAGVMVFSNRSITPWASQLGISVTDSHWAVIRHEVSLLSIVYDNGETMIVI